jgi:hypothetical protein
MFVDVSHLINFSRHFKQNCFGILALTQVLSMSVLSPQRKIVGEFCGGVFSHKIKEH